MAQHGKECVGLHRNECERLQGNECERLRGRERERQKTRQGYTFWEADVLPQNPPPPTVLFDRSFDLLFDLFGGLPSDGSEVTQSSRFYLTTLGCPQ